MKIFPADLATTPFCGRIGFCMSGCRSWARQHGFDWSDFVANGIDAETLLATGDALAQSVIEYKQMMETDQNGER